MQDIDKEKLRAFEQKMHDEGADGFADGPRPWETWDESGAQAPGTGRHVWEGKARRIYKNTALHRSLGERILSGLAMLAIATMVVGIAGVYLTEQEPPAVAWTAVQPTPIPLPGYREIAGTQRLPERAMRPAPVVANIESLPPTAAGGPAAASAGSATATPASRLPSLAETRTDPTNDPVSVGAAPALATLPGDDSPEETATGDTDIEIVAAPSALLLTSNTYASPDGNDGSAEFDVSGMDMDPALAMEIATAPAVASDMDNAPAAASDTTPLSSSTDINRKNARVPATDRINREPQTAGFAAADSAAVLDTAAEPGAADTEPAEIAASRPAPEPATHAAGDQDMAATAAASNETGAEDTEIPAGADMPGAISEASPETGNTVIALAEPEPVTTAPSPAAAAAVTPAGGWVVNLASYTHEAMARRKLAEFQAKGVTGEIESTTINDSPMYRIRVAGFESSRAARASISSLEATLGLKGVWISRR